LNAKITFPELFRSSPARDVQRGTSEVDAARSEAEALEVLSSASECEEGGVEDTVDNIPKSKLPPLDTETRYDPDISKVVSEPTISTAPSLYPSFLPYATQHLILTTAQRQLEGCCFDFTAKWLPSLLKEKKWECAEAAELIKWTRTLAKNSGKFPAGALGQVSEALLNEVFASTNVLRHTAVHRLATSAGGIYKMIQSALRLADTLGDVSRAAELESLCLEIGSRIRDMELSKNFLESRLDEQLRVINKKREELDREEREAIATMLKEDQENTSLVASCLEDAVHDIFGRPESDKTDMVNGGRESDGMDHGNEKDKDQDPGLSNGDIGVGKPEDLYLND
jgi:hypothetical protein